MEACEPVIMAAGYEPRAALEIGSPYISYARARLLGRALADGADIVVFIDDDVSWRPEDIVRLIDTPDPVVAGLYRFKVDEEIYMGSIFHDADARPIVREDGCIKGQHVPAGFLKLTRGAVERFMEAYPELLFGKDVLPTVDLFNHGVHDGLWWGEDMAFSRRWLALGEDIWIIPDLNLTHNGADKAYPGNFHHFMLRQPGGSEHKE
jgi:hypothetical protein